MNNVEELKEREEYLLERLSNLAERLEAAETELRWLEHSCRKMNELRNYTIPALKKMFREVEEELDPIQAALDAAYGVQLSNYEAQRFALTVGLAKAHAKDY